MRLIESLAVESESRILLVVLDGLGGVPRNGKTELEAAWVPNLDRLAAESSLGLSIPVEHGVTPGSGPAHLALFGYDPLDYQVGRGVIEALGVGLELQPGDLCARANFATISQEGRIVDRRAGRIPTERSAALCERLACGTSSIEDVRVIVMPGREHRFVVVFRGEGLGDGLTDSDPVHENAPPLRLEAREPNATKSALVANAFVDRAAVILSGEGDANYVLLRGSASPPSIPSMRERFGLRPACVAVYPMYRGLARLVGMDILDAGETWHSQAAAVGRALRDHDFFFVHFKETDMAGEDGDFDRKTELIERFDEEILPQFLKMDFDVLCITGDHSTPAVLKGHSWHPVPLLLHSRFVRTPARIEEFGERACAHGDIGMVYARQVMGLLLAHARKLKKFGA